MKIKTITSFTDEECVLIEWCLDYVLEQAQRPEFKDFSEKELKQIKKLRKEIIKNYKSEIF